MSIWRNSNFLRVWLGQLVSVVGDGMFHTAILWWVKTTTGSDALVATMALCGALPAVLLGPIAGAFADRHDRRSVMMAADIARALVLVVPALLLATGSLQVWHLFITAAALSTFSTFFGPAFGASIPQLVAREHITVANSINQTTFSLGGLLGPALGGLLVATTGSVQVIAIDAFTFAFSGLCILLSRVPSPVRGDLHERSFARDIGEGLRFLRSQPLLWGMLLLFGVLNFLAAPMTVLLPGIAKDVLKTNAAGFGLLEAMLPLGFIIGGLITGVLKTRNIGLFIVWPLVLVGVVFTGVGLSRALPITAAVLVAGGVLLAVCNIFISVVFQTRIPPEIQGRAFGAMGSLTQGLRPLGLAAVAPLVGLTGGAAGVYILCGVLCSICGMVGFLIPGMTAIERPTGATAYPAAAD
jgi:DHA3 family macrolide efflux protein-like MFS transporter